MAWTNPRTWNVGETVTKAMLDEQIRDNMRVLQGGTARQALRMNAGATAPEYGNAIFVRVNRSTTQAIANNTWTPISFDTEEADTDGAWTIGAPTVITIPFAGVWLCGASADFASNATGSRRFALKKGTTYLSYITEEAEAELGVSLTTAAVFAASDALTFSVFQNSGGNLNVWDHATAPLVLWAAFLGP